MELRLQVVLDIAGGIGVMPLGWGLTVTSP